MVTTIRNSKGFTLVELAIVLVIIGIILGAVLKGQELVNSAKAKRAYNDVRGVTAGVYTYMDKYGLRLPGDDPNATAALRGAGWVVGTGGTLGNGQIFGAETPGTNAAPGTMFTCAAGATTEGCILWDHLKRSNILAGAVNSTNPVNPYGGTIGVAYVTVSGLAANWIGISNVPGDVAQQMDAAYDDGVGTTGNIRALAAYTAGSQVPILVFFRL
jgi:prepilin-type N-terminal cleavage/methylation domain-containing protein